MDRVAAEVAQEVGMLFQHDDVDAGAPQQKAEHHAGRTTAHDAAGGLDTLIVESRGLHKASPRSMAITRTASNRMDPCLHMARSLGPDASASHFCRNPGVTPARKTSRAGHAYRQASGTSSPV